MLQGSGASMVQKDQDLQQQYKLEQDLVRRVHEQLDTDTRLLSSLRVMDYSMLLGVHQRSRDASSSTAGASKAAVNPAQQQQQHNFAEHSNEAGEP